MESGEGRTTQATAAPTEMESGEGRTTLATVSTLVLEKRGKHEEEVASDGAMGVVGITKRPKTEGDMVPEAGSKESKSTAKRPKTEMVVEAGSKEESKSMAKPAGVRKKTIKKMVRLPKAVMDYILQNPLCGYRRISNWVFDVVPGAEKYRAMEDKMATMAEKMMDARTNILKQFYNYGYAEVEEEVEVSAVGLRV